MRTFYAVTFSDLTKEALIRYRDMIADSSIKGRFTRQDNFHLTLEFIGDTDGEKLEKLLYILEGLRVQPMNLSGSYIGSFKKRNREIIWMGLDKNRVLLELQKELNRKLKDEQIILKQQKYRPHITLGRQVLMARDLKDLVIEPLMINPISVALMESKRVGEKLVYEVVEELLFNDTI